MCNKPLVWCDIHPTQQGNDSQQEYDICQNYIQCDVVYMYESDLLNHFQCCCMSESDLLNYFQCNVLSESDLLNHLQCDVVCLNQIIESFSM